jgi:hypothetical protein
VCYFKCCFWCTFRTQHYGRRHQGKSRTTRVPLWQQLHKQPDQNCWHNYMDSHCCKKAVSTEGVSSLDRNGVQVPLPHILGSQPGTTVRQKAPFCEDLAPLHLLCPLSLFQGGKGNPGYMAVPNLRPWITIKLIIEINWENENKRKGRKGKK